MLTQPGRILPTLIPYAEVTVTTNQSTEIFQSKLNTPEVDYIVSVAKWRTEIKEAIGQLNLSNSQDLQTLHNSMNLLILEMGVCNNIPYNCELLHAGLIRLVAYIIIALEAHQDDPEKKTQYFKLAENAILGIDKDLQRLYDWGVIPSSIYKRFEANPNTQAAVQTIGIQTDPSVHQNGNF